MTMGRAALSDVGVKWERKEVKITRNSMHIVHWAVKFVPSLRVGKF